MIDDFRAVTGTVLRPDVAVVGAGVAGLLLANRLRERGRTVVVLESGSRTQGGDEHPLNEVEMLGEPYHGATRGRARCLGGTSTRWGGAMLPFFPEDLADSPAVGVPAWGVGFDALRPGLGYLEQLFRLDPGSFEEDFLATPEVPRGDPEFTSRFAKWPRFPDRNLAQLLARRLATDTQLQTILDATVTRLDVDPASGRVRAVRAAGPDGSAVMVEPGAVALCAGAIENTRLLLNLHRDLPTAVPAGDGVLGRYFHDHLSTPVATFPRESSPLLNRLAGFRFAGGTMRSHRFELRPSAQRALGIPSLWAHIAFGTDEPTAIDDLRIMLRGIQKGEFPGPAQLLRLARHGPFLAGMAWWRLSRKQLLWPPSADARMHIVVEQVPDPSNRISLGSRRDRFGIPVAAIDWRVTDRDHATVAAGRRALKAFFARSGLEARVRPVWSQDRAVGDQTTRYGDVYHPGGTTRMGSSPQDSVLDTDLRVHGTTNLYAPSTAAFPRGAGANPTFMLMLFCYRLAEHLAGGQRTRA